MTATPVVDEFANLLSHGGACSCPICSGKGLDQLQEFVLADPVGGDGGTSSSGPVAALTGLPQLNSLPGAAKSIFLDFDGHFEAQWGSDSNVSSPAYDRDGDPNSFSTAEIAAIQEIWTRVAEDFAPFNINVTTVQPPQIANGVAIRVVIGGDSSDWFGSSAGGVAYIGGFYNGASNVAYVFEDDLANGNPRYVAEAASHEAGHTFGLLHQAVWSGGSLVEEYNPGSGGWAPIMGVGYYEPRTTWHYGPTSDAPSDIQNDLAILANSLNGFGYRPDDAGNSVGTAATMAISGTSVNQTGRIGVNGDWDFYSFTTGGGTVSFTLNVAQFGANLDAVLDIVNGAGQVLATVSPTTSLGATISASVGAGTYYLAVHGVDGYGNLGQYTISGTVPAAPQAPEISISLSGSEVADGSAVSFGTTQVGTPVTRTFTVRNAGTGTLALTPLNAASLPAGFTLMSNLGATTLAAGASTTFSVRLDAAAVGSYSGSISLVNTDSNENPYDLQLSGTVNTTPAPPPVPSFVRTIDDGASGFLARGTWRIVSNHGHGGDFRYATKGTGSTTATWTFSNLQPGTYRVAATWPASSFHASNAPYTVLNGAQSLATVRVDQRAAPNDFTAGGVSWEQLGTFTITGSRLVVRLTNGADATVAADAIRIERVAATGEARLAAANPVGAPSASSSTAAVDHVLSALVGASSDANSSTPATQSGVRQEAAGRQIDAAFQPSAWRHEVVQLARTDVDPELRALQAVSGLLDDVATEWGGSSSRTERAIDLLMSRL